MKKTATLLILLLAAILPVSAQTWAKQTSGTTRTINSIWATSPTSAFTVGANGGGWRTADGGQTWTAMPLGGITSDLHAIKFLNAATGMACGDNQHVVTTANGGASWTSIGGGITDVHDLALLSAANGWVVGEQEVGYGFIYNPFTFDLKQPSAVQGKEIYGIWFNGAKGYLVGAGGLVLTSGNSGNTWSQQSSGVSTRLNKVMCSGQVCVAVGNNGLILRTDGQGTWLRENSGTGQNLNAVYFPTDSTVFAVGDSGIILRGGHRGPNWVRESSPVTTSLRAIHGSGTGSVWAVGDGGVVVKRDAPTAAKGISEAYRLSLHPNPATDKLSIESEKPIQSLAVYNLLGERRLSTKTLGRNSVLDIAVLEPGVYLLEVQTATGTQVRKFQKL